MSADRCRRCSSPRRHCCTSATNLASSRKKSVMKSKGEGMKLTCQNGWVLAYLTFTRFAYLLLIFPFLQRGGRRLYHRYQVYRSKSSTHPNERSRLIQRQSYREREEKSEANHFDVSVCPTAEKDEMPIRAASSWPDHSVVRLGSLRRRVVDHGVAVQDAQTGPDQCVESESPPPSSSGISKALG